MGMDYYAVRIFRCHLHGGVEWGSGGSADQYRRCHSATFQFSEHLYHFIERRSDESGESYHVGAPFLCFIDDGLWLNHDSEVLDIVAVAEDYYADNVFSYIVYIAFYCRHEDFAGGRR